MKFGVQLYTLHDYTKTLEDFEETLRKVAEIGFKYVQVSGTCEFEPEWLKEKLEKYGLECVLTHTNPAKMFEDAKKVCDDHTVFNCDYIGLGGMPRLWNFDDFTSDEVVDKFVEEYLPIMETFKENGKYMMYHNHHYEFAKMSNGNFMWDELAKRIPANLMGFTLDTYWIQYGGKNPVKEIKKLAGRLPCVHFKDYAIARGPRDPSIRFAPIGSGNLDWDEIIAACKESGVKYALIEQDNSFGAVPFECLKFSYDFLISKGLEAK